MAESKRRQRPKGAELRASLKSKDRLTNRDVEVASGALGATAATDPFFSRNEFKPGFYTQKDQPPITAETMYGKGTTRSLEYPTIDPDTKMIQDTLGMSKGGSAGQYAVQVKKVPFKGVF
jgi:hypothetical protein